MCVKDIVKNKGATLTKTLRKSILKTGYMVSIKGYEIQVDASDFTKLSNEIFKTQQLSKFHKNSYIGIWIEDEIAYIDLSINIKDLKEATSFGTENEQLAIYGIKNSELLYI